MSATGETTWSSKGKTPVKFEFEPLPANNYEGRIVASKTELQGAQGPGNLPYINVAIEVLNSATKEGGKNRYVFQMFWLSLKKGKDGVSSPERASNIVGLARAYGEETPDFNIVTMEGNIKDKEGNVTGTEMHDLLEPRAVLQWLKDHDGQVFKFHSKIETYKDKKKATVDYFIASDTQAF